MKKNLWITAVAMAVGIGMSAQADDAGLGQWSFEELAPGTRIPSRSSPISSPTGYGSWSADTNTGTASGTAIITNSTAPSGVLPISGATHTNALYFDGSVTNHFVISTPKRFFTDFLLKPGVLENANQASAVTASSQLGFYFNSESNFVLLHGERGTANIIATTNTAIKASNAWYRITVEADYNAAGYETMEKSAFQIYINGVLFQHELGYLRTGDTFNPAGVGSWFPTINNSGASMTALVGIGVGLLDDVVTATTVDFGVSISEIGILASTFNAAYGSLSPSGYQTITSGTPRVFTVMVATNMCYVTALTTNGVEVYGNANSSIVSTQWNISYEQVLVGGTNFVAMFAAKSGTSGSYLDDYFNIGGVDPDYPSFEVAATNDADLDGFSNYQESVAGTDPTNALDYLEIANLSVETNGNVVVVFKGSVTGLSSEYQIHQANTITGAFSSVTNFAKVSGTNNISLTPAATKKFYKIIAPYTGQ